MHHSQYPVSFYPVELPRHDLRVMIRAVRLLHKLSENSAYQALLQAMLPESARVHHGYHSVMMGYDFHLGASGPKLIEVNTNAGGIWFACLCEVPDATIFPERKGRKLLNTFIAEYALFSKNASAHPECIVILDDHPQNQFLYPEMQVFAKLFQQAGITAMIADPESISVKNGCLYCNDKRIDMIYNRHCDFYLRTPAMKIILDAWMNAQVCLSPNPHIYGLLADKQRMILWSHPELLSDLDLNTRDMALLAETIPQTRLLESMSAEEAWRTRKQWVFKPDNGYASRGVYVGEKLTKTKFAELNPHNTLMQQRVPPSHVKIGDDSELKTDFRLFVYRNRVLGISARIYQGQVTNMRTENGGFAKVVVV
ncbi:MAG: hypothetical protein ACXWT3_12550 [Methylococcaceae bacterium]